MKHPLFIAVYEATCPHCNDVAYRLLQVRDLQAEQQRIAKYAFGDVRLVAWCNGNWRTARNILTGLGQPEGGAIALPLEEIVRVMQRCASGVEMQAEMQAKDSPAPVQQQDDKAAVTVRAIIARREQGEGWESFARDVSAGRPAVKRLLEQEGIVIP